MKLSAVVIACFVLLASHVLADSVTLNSGEIIQGEIVSETDSQVVIKVSKYNRTITSEKVIPKSDIKAVDRESDQQNQERHAYETLVDSWKLDPNNEFTKAKYEQGVKAFNEYLTTYPESKFADNVRQTIPVWTGELAHVERGEVKFNNQWMTPDEKRQRAALTTAYNLRQRLTELQKQHDQVLKAISDGEAAIRHAQDTIANPPTRWNDGHFVWHHGALYPAGDAHYETDNGALSKARQDLAANQSQLDKLSRSLPIIENQIDVTSRQLAEAEATYKGQQGRETRPSFP